MYLFMQENKKIYSQLPEIDKDNKHYLDIIIDKSDNYLKEIFYRLINLLSEVQFPVDTGDFRLIDKTVI